MKEINCFDDSFNIGKTLSYDLSMQINTQGYAYSIVDTIRNKYVAIKTVKFKEEILEQDIATEFSKVLAEDGFLTKKYKSINFLGSSPKSILMPTVLFDKNSLKSFFEFNHRLGETEEIHYNQLRNAGAYNVFTLNSDITTLLINSFPKIRFYHQNTPFIEIGIKNNKNTRNDSVFVDVNVNHLTVVVLSEKKLRLSNTFYYKEVSDLVFFVLNVYYQLGLNFEFNELYLSGKISEKSDAYKELKTFIERVHFNEVNNDITYPFAEKTSSVLNLLNSHRCES